MKVRLAGVFFAGLSLTALGIPFSSLAESPGTGGAPQPAVSQSVVTAESKAASPSVKAIIPPLTRMPLSKKKRAGGFGDLPVTPSGSDREDCFNDPIPYTPVPQG